MYETYDSIHQYLSTYICNFTKFSPIPCYMASLYLASTPSSHVK